MNPQNLLVSLFIIPHRLDKELAVHEVQDGLYWQKYCQIFPHNLFCFSSLPFTVSVLVLSHAKTRILSSSTLNLVPRLGGLLEVVISTSREEIGLF